MRGDKQASMTTGKKTAMSCPDLPRLLDLPDGTLIPEEEAAGIVDKSRVTLRRYRSTGEGPRFHKIGRGPTAPIYYRKEALIQWLESFEVRSTAEALERCER
jgi:hypothetical protein